MIYCQPVIDELGPPLGTTFVLNYDEGQYEPGAAGENEMYDYSSFDAQGAFSYSVIDPADTELGPVNYPESTSCWTFNFDGIGDFFSYFDFSENLWREWGTAGGGTFGAVTYYTDPIDRISGPINYGDSGSDEYSGELISVQNTPISGTTNYIVDGYGTLVLPFGTFENCIRVLSTTEEIQELGVGFEAENNYTEYIYFVQGYPLPIVYYSILESYVLGELEETSYQLSVVSDYNGEPLAVENQTVSELNIFPNPATDEVLLNLNEIKSTVRIFDLQGKQVHSSLYFEGQRLDISRLLPGIYIVEAEGDSGIYYRQKLVVQ